MQLYNSARFQLHQSFSFFLYFRAALRSCYSWHLYYCWLFYLFLAVSLCQIQFSVFLAQSKCSYMSEQNARISHRLTCSVIRTSGTLNKHQVLLMFISKALSFFHYLRKNNCSEGICALKTCSCFQGSRGQITLSLLIYLYNTWPTRV